MVNAVVKLRGKHPREQGLKLATLSHLNAESDFEENIQENKDWNQEMFPWILGETNFEENIQENKDWNDNNDEDAVQEHPLRGKHPREQGLKLKRFEGVFHIGWLRGKHPREQGLKHGGVDAGSRKIRLRGKHPREQGLKPVTPSWVYGPVTFEENIQENKDWNTARYQCARGYTIFEENIQENKDWNTPRTTLWRSSHSFEENIQENKDWNRRTLTERSRACTSRKTSKRTRIETPRATRR